MSITKNIYSEWMKETQEKKYEGIFLDFLIPMRQKLKLDEILAIDVGVGNGWFEKHLLDRGMETKVIGVDVDRRGKDNVEGLQIVDANGNFLPFREKSFGLLVSLDTIHLLNNHDELMRVVNAKGYLLISTFCNEYNLRDRRESILQAFPTCTLLKEGVVGDSDKEQSYVAFFKNP